MEKKIFILHLEDDPSDAELIKATIDSSNLSCHITVVQTRDEFSSALRNKKFDIILGDYRLSGYDGISALHLSTELCPDVPFIFVSGVMGEDAAIDCLTQGATDYVLKQKLVRLVPAIKRALREAKVRRERNGAKEALLKNEQLFRVLVEQSRDHIARYDLNFRRIYVNPALQELFEKSNEEVLGKIPDKDSPIYAPQEYIDYLKQVIETSTEIVVEMPFRTTEGEIHWGHLRFIPEFGSDGKVVSVIAIGRNINEIKENEYRFRLLMENFPDFVVRFDRNYRFTYVNPIMEKAIGLPIEEIIGKTMPELQGDNDPEQTDFLANLIRQTFEKGVPNKAEALFKTPIGERIFETRHIPEKDATGKVVSVLGITRDITEHKRAEEELAAREFELRNLAESSPDLMGTFYQRPDGSVCMPYTSPQIWNLYGLHPEDVVDDATPLLERNHPDDIQRVNDSIAESARTMTPWNCEFRVNHPTRGEIWLEGSTNPTPHPDGGIIWYGFIHDITKRKEAEQALNRLNRELRAISKCNQTVIRTSDEYTLNKEICSIICDDAGYRMAWVGYAEHNEAKTIRPVAWAGSNSGDITNAKLSWDEDSKYGNGPAGLTIRSGEKVYVQDVNADDRMTPWREAVLENECRSGISLPLKDEDKNVFGALQVYSSEVNAITPEESRLMEELADDLAFGIITLRNRAERSKAEEELREREAFLSSIVENIPNMIFIKDAKELRFVRFNKSGEDLLGLNRDDLIGKTDYDFFSREQADFFVQMDREVLKSGRLCDIPEEPINTKSGERILHTKKMPILDKSGNPVYLLGISEDITDRKTAELELQRSNSLLRATIDAAPTAIIGLDLDGRVENVWNAAAERILGWSAQEVMGRFLPTVPQESKKEFKGLMDRLGKGSRIEGVEVRRQRKDGSLIDYSIYASPLVDAEGNISGSVTVLVDITERKKAELQLIESERKFRSLAESSPDNIIRYDTDGRLIYINHNYELTVGINLRSVVGIKPEEYRDIKPPSSHFAAMKKVIETGMPQDIEVEVPNPGGELRTHLVRYVAERNNEKEIIGVLSIGRDITERKRTEETLHKLSHAVEQSPVSIIMTNTQGEIEYANPKFTETTGYTWDEVRGKNPRILKSGETPQEEYKQLWETITAGKEWRGVFHNKKKNGALYWESASISPIFDAVGTITHFIAVKENITEQKNLEEQLRQAQKMEAIGQLAGGVAHDFNNMLNVILGHAQMALLKNVPDDSLRKDLEAILEASHRSADITRQLLAFARKQTISPKILDLNDIVEGMLKMLRRLIGEDIDLSWLPESKLWRVKMDPSQVDQILANLCVNAKDALNGVGKITIETHKTVLDDIYCAEHKGFNPGEYVMLAVSDNGSGMDKQTMDKIFEPFFTTKGLGKGTGLGLSTVYGIVKQNLGFINAYSEPGHGSTFKIYLPRYVIQNEKIQKKSSNGPLINGSETILLVEDDSLVLEISKKMLEKLGYTVLSASNPKDAIGLAIEHSEDMDMLITDMVLPGMTGLDLEKKIKDLRPEMKCLFMSGYTGNVIAHHSTLDDGVNFIQKPFSVQDFGAKVREVLDSK